jgi:hypothetical protein
MTIATKKTVYVLGGKEFKYNQLEKHLTDKLGSHIDKMTDGHKLPPKIALAMLDYMIENRDDIIEILGTSVIYDQSSLGQKTYINILANKAEDRVWEKR